MIVRSNKFVLNKLLNSHI